MLFRSAAVGVDGGGVAVLGQCDLSVGLGEGLTGNLVGALGLTGLTSPAVSNLLVGVTWIKLAYIYELGI